MLQHINIPDHILFEDDFILVLDKPCGLMVEPDRNGHPNLLHLVKKYLKKSNDEVYAQHIHRLDRPVSGIVLFTKQKSVLKNLSEQFAERKVKKYYQALTVNAPEQLEGKLEHWHRKEKKKARIVPEGTEYAEKVMLSYSVQALPEKCHLWNIELHTGKFHQIRAQLSAVNCPINGDILYGSTAEYKPDSIALHACRLIFFHPVSEEVMAIESSAQLLK